MGDALGLPYEGLRRRRAARLLGPPDRYRFLFGRGMVSDDTEHACLVAQSLVSGGPDVCRFTVELARRLRWWLAGIPAGIGWATLRAILRLWCGIPPERSGIWSAGNGPAMRAPLLGVVVDEVDLLRAFVRASTRITHTDPKAEWGALSVAWAARMAARCSPPDADSFVTTLGELLDENAAGFLQLIEAAAASVRRGEFTPAFATQIGCHDRVSGYVYQTVPVAIHAWLRHPADFRAAVTNVIECGGDTDTTAAIVGGIVGAGVGRAGIPDDLLRGLCEWPRSVAWVARLSTQLARVLEQGEVERPLRVPMPGVLLRNLLFASVVLAHGFRRLAPPY